MLGLQTGADGRAAPGHAVQAGRPRKDKGLVDELVATPGRAASRPPRPGSRANPDDRTPREPVGPPGLQDARRHPEVAGAGRVPAGVPGAAAQADSRARTTRPSRRSCPPPSRARRSTSTPRSRIESRYLTSLITGQNSKNMIQAFFFDLQAINAGVAAPAGRRAVPRHQGRRARRRDDGRRHRLRRAPAPACEVVLKDVALESAEKGKAYSREAARQGDRPRQARPRRRRPSCSARITADRRPGRPRRLRPGDRGGLRGPGAQGAGVRRGRAVRRRRRAALLQHLDAADHRAGRGRRPAGGLHRAALLLARRQDAAGRDHPRRGDLRRGAGQGLRRRPADPEDADRGQRQPRLLHLARHRHAWSTRAWRCSPRASHPVSLERAADPGRLPGRAAAAHRRAQHGADGQDRARPPRTPPSATGGRTPPHPAERGRRRRCSSSAVRRGSRAPGFYDYDENGKRTGLWPGLAEAVPGRRASSSPFARHQGPDAVRRGARDRQVLRGGRASTSAAAANIGSIMGIGFPPTTGGAAQFMTGYEAADGADRPDGVRRPGRRARRDLRRAVPAHGVPARPGRAEGSVPGLTPRAGRPCRTAVRRSAPNPLTRSQGLGRDLAR